MAEFADQRVFVSYAHDNSAHKDAVLRLCELIRAENIDVRLDQRESSERRDWYAWMTDNILQSEFVIVVASPRYRSVGDGTGPPHQNRGVQAEACLLRDLLHANRTTWTRKLLPVVLPGHTIDEIPLFLQPYCADHYLIDTLSRAGLASLLEAITSTQDVPLPVTGATSPIAAEVEGAQAPAGPELHQSATAKRRSTVIQVGGNLTITEPNRGSRA
ncbi:toll/interleukin-1 receptor domain-containing protein [Amycolatopsis sp. NBC_00355]|uniref:toll/interleukin-1 receptor domain-containing protein n=1 Tax=Amycolatopsis sp. NBC_00355 TaxID=2975957 RepID=UPI002E270F21